MKARLARISARVQALVQGHLNDSMADIHRSLRMAKKEVGAARVFVEDPELGVEDIVDGVVPCLDAIEGYLDSVIDAK